jgi:DNA mismatch repair protein MutS
MAGKLTPMMEQYLGVKEQYPGCILFFRLGDFYEMFFEDAKTASKELEITLTAKNCGLEEKAPMCGVPHHSAENYINRLIEKGYKVALAEQVEDPAQAKGIVKRDVVRVYTPGSNINMQSLDESKNNYLMSVYSDIGCFGISYVDVTTGDFYTTTLRHYGNLLDEIAKIRPVECIINEALSENLEFVAWLEDSLKCYINHYKDWFFAESRAEEILKRQFNVQNLDGLSLGEYTECICASGALMDYLLETQKNHLDHISHVRYYEAFKYMHLDMATRRNLELTETMREKDKRGSLLWVLDSTKTAMGARKLRTFIEQPLTNQHEIEKRLDGVSELYDNLMIREEIRELLTPVYDMERLMTKMTLQTANPRDLLAFRQSIHVLPGIKETLETCDSEVMLHIGKTLDTLEDLDQMIEEAIHEEPPITVKEGRIIRDGFHEEVDRLRRASTDGKQWLASLEAKERELTGIKNLKIKYNKVFGYYLEVTNSNLHMVPEERYQRKQTLANAERFITPELKEIENTVLGANDKLMALEYELYVELRNKLASQVSRIKETASLISSLDALQSLAHIAIRNHFVRPAFNNTGLIEIKEGRHPVIEKIMANDGFIVNDTLLDNDDHRFSIITGPNMAGKSTYMRQVALITLMAQLGSFVPAKEANISPVDRIFTRVGASDDLSSGKSTFMVEMSEVANILRNATKNSLVILDEIGRGTSTFDGLSIAWAVVEYLVDVKSIGAKTLFATHYHELTELEGKIDGVQNYCITVKEKGDDIIFLRKIAKGGADKSYGIQVAKIAGVPDHVIVRSKEILEELSDADITKKTKELVGATQPLQMNLFEPKEDKLRRKIKGINVNTLTPIEAMNLLNELVTQVNHE